MKVMLVVGARPNFMKVAPIIKEMKNPKWLGFFDITLVHTGQHYDSQMSDVFFRDLDLPKPDIFLGVGSGSHAEQTAKVMIASEPHLLNVKPDLAMVVGDVNSTIAVALTAKKLNIPVAHVEAGLRSNDQNMPEEINRILTDHISDFLFTTEASANVNLKKEGIEDSKIHLVGNVMIDSLIANLDKAQNSSIFRDLKLTPQKYALLTLHRPSNVDNKENFLQIFRAIEEIQKEIPIVFPIHPRTRKQISDLGLGDYFSKMKNIISVEPLGYVDFLALTRGSRFVMTDSGGLQEESTALQVPCLTLRENTERPITVEIGSNQVIGIDTQKIIQSAKEILSGKFKQGKIPDIWNGRAAERIVDIINKKFKK